MVGVYETRVARVPQVLESLNIHFDDELRRRRLPLL